MVIVAETRSCYLL